MELKMGGVTETFGDDPKNSDSFGLMVEIKPVKGGPESASGDAPAFIWGLNQIKKVPVFPRMIAKKTVYFLYTSDSLDSIMAASMLTRIKTLYHGSVINGAAEHDTVDLVIESINSASIPANAETVVWLGMEPTHAVFTGATRSMPKGVKNICISENNPWVDDSTGALGGHIAQLLGDQSELLQKKPYYGLILRMLSALEENTDVAKVLPVLRTRFFLDWAISRQQDVAAFNNPVTPLEYVQRIFAEGVQALCVLGQPGGLIDTADPKKAYAQVLGTVRAQLKKSGHAARSTRKDITVVAWFTHINEFYWVALRQVRSVYKYYMNVSMCRTGTMTFTNVPATHHVRISQDIIRSK